MAQSARAMDVLTKMYRGVAGLLAVLLLLSACGGEALQRAGALADPSPSTQGIPAFGGSVPEPYKEAQPQLNMAEQALLHQLYEDAGVDEVYRRLLARAVCGNGESQLALRKSGEGPVSLSYALFPYQNSGAAYDTKTVFYHIGRAYCDGIGPVDAATLGVDKPKALHWFDAAADRGHGYAAVLAGDLLAEGDGVPQDPDGAFNRYTQALAIQPNGTTYQRLGNCYLKGIGVAPDPDVARRYFQESAYEFDTLGLYQLAAMTDASQPGAFALYKAASSADYSPGYFAVAYADRDYYSAASPKRDLLSWLDAGWKQETDPVAGGLKVSIRGNAFYSESFVEQLLKTCYSYAYYHFVDRHVLMDYTADYTGDGALETGYYRHGAIGGAFMPDTFLIYKHTQPKTEEELWDETPFAWGPYASLRDGMRIIRYDGRVYFLVNYFSENKDRLYDIFAYTLDPQGQGHTLDITCADYVLTPADSLTEDAFATGYDALIDMVEDQAVQAVEATRQQTLYHTDEEVVIESPEAECLPRFPSNASPTHRCFYGDINNDGQTESVYRSHASFYEGKYYYDVTLVNAYHEDRDELLTGPYSRDDSGDYYGHHAGGNIYDILPITGLISQFWTVDYEGLTYCAVLTRRDTIYALHVYLVEGEVARPVHRVLYLDEPQSIHVAFDLDLASRAF